MNHEKRMAPQRGRSVCRFINGFGIMIAQKQSRVPYERDLFGVSKVSN
jgi:hypothetical protein